jgi:hypothetical protein
VPEKAVGSGGEPETKRHFWIFGAEFALFLTP